VQCQMHSQTSELKALLEAEAGKTWLAQQQQMAAQAESAAEMANLRSLLEYEVKKCAQAEAEHKAAQADLAEQLRHATSLTHQLDQEGLDTPMLAPCAETEELAQKVAALQVWPLSLRTHLHSRPVRSAALLMRRMNQVLLLLQGCKLLTQVSICDAA